MVQQARKSGMRSTDIKLGRVYQVLIENVVYKAVVVQVLPEEKFLLTVLEPMVNFEQATLKFGSNVKLPASAFLAPYALPKDEDGTEEDYLVSNLPHKATLTRLKVSFYVGKSDSGPDHAQYGYTWILTDPEHLGNKSILVDVFVPLEGIGRKDMLDFTDEERHSEDVYISTEASYWYNTDDPEFSREPDDASDTDNEW